MTFLQYVFGIVIIILIGLVVKLLVRIDTLEARVKRLEYANEQTASGFKTIDQAVDAEVQALLHEGKDVEAVKRIRETLGLSLLDAKQYVDRLKKP